MIFIYDIMISGILWLFSVVSQYLYAETMRDLPSFLLQGNEIGGFHVDCHLSLNRTRGGSGYAAKKIWLH